MVYSVDPGIKTSSVTRPLVGKVILTRINDAVGIILLMWPKSYQDIGPQSTFPYHLVCHRTLSITLGKYVTTTGYGL